MRSAIENAKKEALRLELMYFVKRTFEELNPGELYYHNWHIESLCEYLIEIYLGKATKLAICMPPRYLKSLCISIAFPAWVLGKRPDKKVIVASYGLTIASKLSYDTKKVMSSSWYKKLFPKTIIAKGQNQKNRFETTRGGFRLAVSSGGSLTGEGGDFVIVDDPHKPITINSEKLRKKVIEWFQGTFLSRLNNKRNGGVIIVMQRLHEDDLMGFLIKKKVQNDVGWKFLTFPAISENGEVLHETRENMDDLMKLQSQMGENDFRAQYLQRPAVLAKGLIKEEKIQLIEYVPEEGEELAISIDSASKVGEENDFTAITVWSLKENETVLVDATKVKLEFGSLRAKINGLIKRMLPRYVIIEDKSSGTQLIQELQNTDSKIIGVKPRGDKITRFCPSVVYFENGFIKVNKNIPILKDLMEEVLTFPNSPNDDFVDSISQFIKWREDVFGRFSLHKKPPPPSIRIL